MSGVKIKFGEDVLAQSENDAEILDILGEFQRNFKSRNPALRLDHLNGSRLYVLLSDLWCSASFESSTREVYQLINSNNKQDKSSDSIRFMNGSHATYIHLQNCVYFEQITQIVNVFVNTGELPITIATWEHWGKTEPYL